MGINREAASRTKRVINRRDGFLLNRCGYTTQFVIAIYYSDSATKLRVAVLIVFFGGVFFLSLLLSFVKRSRFSHAMNFFKEEFQVIWVDSWGYTMPQIGDPAFVSSPKALDHVFNGLGDGSF